MSRAGCITFATAVPAVEPSSDSKQPVQPPLAAGEVDLIRLGQAWQCRRSSELALPYRARATPAATIRSPAVLSTALMLAKIQPSDFSAN